MIYFPRKLEKLIQPWLDKPDVIIILGARQVGKTSLLNILMENLRKQWGESKNILLFNLEDSEQLDALNRNPKYFNEYLIFMGADPEKDSIVMIDEVQYLDDPSHFLKYLADFKPSLKLIVTGSTSIAIKKFKDSMTGRKKSFNLYPLDFHEFLSFKGKNRLFNVLDEFNFNNLISGTIPNVQERIAPFSQEMEILFDEYITFGGYPKVVLSRSRDEKLEELRELFEAYELKDVNILFNVANISAFRNLFKILAGSIGNLLNTNELSGNMGIGRDTVRRYLSILENSYITHSLPPFHNNIRKELTKMPKLFFLDTGLRNFALRNFSELNFRPDKGALLENTICCSLLKNLGVIDQLHFWRTISKTEVDFVLTGEKKIAFEVKFASSHMIKRPPGLRAFGNLYPDFKQIVVTYNQYFKHEDLHYIPGWMI